MDNKLIDISKEFIDDIKNIVHAARGKAYAAINTAQVEAN